MALAMRELITGADQLTVAWLTDVLRRPASLPPGRSRPLTVSTHTCPVSHSSRNSTSTTTRLPHQRHRPSYSSNGHRRLGMPSSRSCATRKSRSTSWWADAPELPLARCYDAASDAATGAYHVLLADLTATHSAGVAGHLPPTVAESEQLVDALAQIHAYWWNHPTLPFCAGAWPSAASQVAFAEWATRTYPSFEHVLGDRLSPQRRRMMAQIVAGLPHLLQRLVRGSDLTVIHGDAHIGNVLFPHDPTTRIRSSSTGIGGRSRSARWIWRIRWR